MCFRIPADEVMLKHCSHCTAPDLLFSVDGALGVKGALGISCSPVAVPPDATQRGGWW